MKKLLSMVVAGGLLVGSASMASATDIKVKGKFDFGFGLYTGTSFIKKDGGDNFDALQRFRTQIDFIASESLKGVAAFEIGNTHWGNGGGATWGDTGAGRGTGGAMGSDGVAVEVKHLYIDWLVPNTDLQVRMGVQPFALPRAVLRSDGEDGGFILDDDLAGILLSYNFNENFGANLGWFRPWDGDVRDGNGSKHNTGQSFGQHDEIDVFALTLPIEIKDTMSITPYGVYALVGHELDNGANTNGFDKGAVSNWLSANGEFGDDGKAWWAGLAFDLSYFDPFVAAVDFAYGKYDADHTATGRATTNPDRGGWVAIAKFGYKLDYFTPILFGWYGSGSDDVMKDGLDGMMPALSPDWGLTSFGWSNAHFGGREYLVGDNPAGTWAIGLGLEDIKFVDNLTTHLRVAYFRGTNDFEGVTKEQKAAIQYNYYTAEGMKVLDKDDWGVEVNLDNVINVYENLDMFVELGYVHLNIDGSNDKNFSDDNAWKGYVGFSYSF